MGNKTAFSEWYLRSPTYMLSAADDFENIPAEK